MTAAAATAAAGAMPGATDKSVTAGRVGKYRQLGQALHANWSHHEGNGYQLTVV